VVIRWEHGIRQKIKRQKVKRQMNSKGRRSNGRKIKRQKNRKAEIIIVIILYYKSISTTLKMWKLTYLLVI